MVTEKYRSSLVLGETRSAFEGWFPNLRGTRKTRAAITLALVDWRLLIVGFSLIYCHLILHSCPSPSPWISLSITADPRRTLNLSPDSLLPILCQSPHLRVTRSPLFLEHNVECDTIRLSRVFISSTVITKRPYSVRVEMYPIAWLGDFQIGNSEL